MSRLHRERRPDEGDDGGGAERIMVSAQGGGRRSPPALVAVQFESIASCRALDERLIRTNRLLGRCEAARAVMARRRSPCGEADDAMLTAVEVNSGLRVTRLLARR